MKKLIKLTLFSLLLSSCRSTSFFGPAEPDEPHIKHCLILRHSIECIDSVTGEVEVLPSDEAVGMTAVSPEDLAKILNHHDRLHFLLKVREKL